MKHRVALSSKHGFFNTSIYTSVSFDSTILRNATMSLLHTYPRSALSDNVSILKNQLLFGDYDETNVAYELEVPVLVLVTTRTLNDLHITMLTSLFCCVNVPNATFTISDLH